MVAQDALAAPVALHTPRSRARLLGWITLGIVLATIVMGAVVRATHSGDGCGQSWPGCEGGLVLPGTSDMAHLIELSHRLISGLSLIAMAALVLAVHRAFAAPHPARRAVRWTLAFLIFEALIGAVIVLYGWVTDDRSVARQVSVPLHLVNTFLLTAFMALTLWLMSGNAVPRLRAAGREFWLLLGLAGVLLLMAATGATTSLADTLFAAETMAEGLRQDFDAESALIVRLRILHPIIAVSGGVLLAWFAWRRLEVSERRGHPWPARILVGGVTVQAMLGFVHIALLTPLATGLLHLFIAQVLWLALSFLALTLLAPSEAAPATEAPR
ncbi:MAG: COX15/CtaA family protein [Dehalococcoidia bacterium]|nr:COX15/CtaA family protein [Dehalococcoidia bacterium]